MRLFLLLYAAKTFVSNGTSAWFTRGDMGLNMDAAGEEIATLPNMMTTNRFPEGSKPPKPKTDLIQAKGGSPRYFRFR